MYPENYTVLVPFYRGAVVFMAAEEAYIFYYEWFSSPFIEERLYFEFVESWEPSSVTFSSPFIEERLYLKCNKKINLIKERVLVPFYRGAVVFTYDGRTFSSPICSSRPLLSRSGCIFTDEYKDYLLSAFSSPFIEERLYLEQIKNSCLWY